MEKLEDSLTNSVPAEVADSLEFRDELPPLEQIPSGLEWLWWTLGILLLAALAFGLWQWWKKRPAAAAPAAPVIPAHVKAKSALEKALRLIDDPKPFCIAVSGAVRIYLEDRFSLHAPDRTTEEFLDELRRSTMLMPDQKDSLGEFLAHCDLVKFAQHIPTQKELQSLHDAAYRLVEETQEPSPVEAPNTETKVVAQP